MKRTGRTISLALVLMPLFLAAAGGSEGTTLDRFSREQREKLRAGEVVFESINYDGKEKEQDGIGRGQAYIIVNKPVELCWAIMTRFEKKKEYFPRVVISEVVKKKEDRVWVREVLDFGVANIEYVLVQKMNPKNHRVDYYLDPEYPHDIADTRGFWYWEKINDQSSLLTYSVTRLDVGIPVPQFIVNALSSRDLPGIAQNLKKRIESNGTWKKN